MTALIALATFCAFKPPERMRNRAKSQCCSRGRPIACPASATAEIGMMCVDEHVTMGKQRHVFRAKPRVSGKHSNHTKFAERVRARFQARNLRAIGRIALRAVVCSLPNFLGVAINENTDCFSVRLAASRRFAGRLWVQCSADFADKS